MIASENAYEVFNWSGTGYIAIQLNKNKSFILSPSKYLKAYCVPRTSPDAEDTEQNKPGHPLPPWAYSESVRETTDKHINT